MKRYIIASAVSVALFGAAVVQACGTHPVLSTEKSDSTNIGLFIDRAAIEATQAWSPKKGEPPLGVSQAYQLAREWARGHYQRYGDVKVREVSLTSYSCSRVQDRWYYVFDLIPVIEGNRAWGSGNWAAVLMDGTVIAPREY